MSDINFVPQERSACEPEYTASAQGCLGIKGYYKASLPFFSNSKYQTVLIEYWLCASLTIRNIFQCSSIQSCAEYKNRKCVSCNAYINVVIFFENHVALCPALLEKSKVGNMTKTHQELQLPVWSFTVRVLQIRLFNTMPSEILDYYIIFHQCQLGYLRINDKSMQFWILSLKNKLMKIEGVKLWLYYFVFLLW